MNKPLCICGRSQKLPFCDGSHRSEGWVCGGETSWTGHAFCSSPRYANLALKLASHFQGTLVTPASPLASSETLVCLVDGTDLDSVIALQKKVEASRRLLVSLGIPGGLLSQTFPDYEILSLEGAEPLKAFSFLPRRLPAPNFRAALAGCGPATTAEATALA